MRGMTERTVLGDRCVFPQEWPTLFRMAAVTGLIKAGPCKQRCCECAVGIMAFAARHFPEAHGMDRGSIELGALALVAIVTNLRLLVLGQYPIARGVDIVATRAGDVDLVMAASLPTDATIGCMTAETDLVLLLERHGRLRAEVEDWRPLLALAQHHLAMFTDRSMTGFALQFGKGRALIGRHRVLGLEDREDRKFGLLVVALQAGIGSSARVLGGGLIRILAFFRVLSECRHAQRQR